jgi:hypothetical protein
MINWKTVTAAEIDMPATYCAYVLERFNNEAQLNWNAACDRV